MTSPKTDHATWPSIDIVFNVVKEIGDDLKHLKAAGNWALKVASEIGVQISNRAIENAHAPLTGGGCQLETVYLKGIKPVFDKSKLSTCSNR
ncbi:hypothetical protein [Pseudomonas sp.]|uniref:hypothetical protein n=1 Tax=Pseudomonas sp. TaxID=306 RepID=UPI002488198A|nr:hypothetical protein [Pseudomonas sp.]MDI1333968.1 hypothetical protein [Pseudomonas sp.]